MSINLPRLPLGSTIADGAGKVTVRFQTWWQSVVRAIETQEATQDQLISDLQATQADLVAAQADIVAAQADIVDAQADILAQLALVNAVTLANAISASYIVPTSPLAATDAGTDATIMIANFTRYYDDGTNVLLDSIPDIIGLAYGTTYWVYYDDATRVNGDPTFVATTDALIARHNFASGRHFVGEVITPASGGGDTGGSVYPPPGGGDFP